MLTFLQYVAEGINTKDIQVPDPDIEDDGYEVYTYPTGHDILQVGIGPNEAPPGGEGSHHVWFTHGGSFGRAMDISTGRTEVPKDPGFAMRMLSHVAATIKHHSGKTKAKDYTYETANKTRHNIYQRVGKAAGVNARNLMPADNMFDRHEPVENWPSWMRPERLDEDMPYMTDTRSRRPGFDYKSEPEIPAQLGKIGSYRIFHHKNHEEAGSEAVSIVHRNKQVGVIPIERYSGRISPSYPMVAAGHSSRRARVKNLIPKVYGLMADKLGTMESGSEQTPGSRSVWARLAKMRDVRVKGPDAQKRVTRTYSHPEHPGMEMSRSRYDYYSRRYRDLKAHTRIARGTRTSLAQDHARFARAALRELRSSLHRSGMVMGKARNIRTIDQLPHPRSFKKKVTRDAPISGRYSPQKHDATVYHPERGGEYTLLLPGKKKAKRKSK